MGHGAKHHGGEGGGEGEEHGGGEGHGEGGLDHPGVLGEDVHGSGLEAWVQHVWNLYPPRMLASMVASHMLAEKHEKAAEKAEKHGDHQAAEHHHAEAAEHREALAEHAEKMGDHEQAEDHRAAADEHREKAAEHAAAGDFDDSHPRDDHGRFEPK